MNEVLESGLNAPASEAGAPGSWYGMRAGAELGGRYRIERLISRGGMGAVFEATQLGLDRAVAIKLLLPSLSRDEKMRERFRREARSAASLRHPNIIQIYDYGISDHGPYIVMELARGKSLRQLLSQGALEISLSVELMSQICSALDAAHSAQIIHRDLKPDNIIVEEQSDGRVIAKVLDFGIAKMREGRPDEECGANLTGANIIGSPAYMSPEQSLGDTIDARSDIYSLGVVLYEMLTGSTPFGKGSAGALMTRQINAPPPRLAAARPEIPVAIEAVVMRALAKDREARFASATQFAHALRKAFDDPEGFAAEYEMGFAPDAGGFTTERIETPLDAYATGSFTGTLRRRLAILPLRNLAGDPEIDFLGFALADSVITHLAPLKSLIVRPSSAVEKYRDQVIEPRAVGRELQVDTILSGSYLKAGDTFRVNAQLVDVSRNEILWQERIDLKFDNVISLQDKICEELIRGLRLKVTTGEQEAIKRDEARNPLAYEFYLRGLAFSGANERRQAIEMLEASVGIDPSYAPAWAALAGCYINARVSLRDETMLDKAEAAARKALEINPQLPAAFFWLAVYYGEKGDLKNALAICKQLLQAAPNSEYAYQAMGHAYDYAGLTEVALTLFRKAAEINPVAYPHMLGFLQYQKGAYAEARRELEACPDSIPEKHFWLAAIDVCEGKDQDAARRLEEMVAGGGSGLFHMQARALMLALKGEREAGKQVLAEALAAPLQLSAYHYYITAQVCAQLAEVDSCVEMLWGAVEAGYGNYPFLISDPLLGPARNSESFIEVAAAMRKLQTRLQLMLVTG